MLTKKPKQMTFYRPENINPPSFYEKEVKEVTVKCDLCLEFFPEEEKESLGDCNCVCGACIILNDENK